MKKNKEVEKQTSQAEDASIGAEEKWQEEYESEMRSREEILYEGALLERKRIMDSLRKFLEQEENTPVKPISVNLINDPCSVKELLIVERIDLVTLVNDLEKRQFFEPKYKIKVLSWFNGFLRHSTIPIKVSADIFVSLIADMMDANPSYIKNTKIFVSSYIGRSFTFKGKKCTDLTIRQIMKPGTHKNRIFYKSGLIPNIEDYIKNSTT